MFRTTRAAAAFAALAALVLGLLVCGTTTGTPRESGVGERLAEEGRVGGGVVRAVRVAGSDDGDERAGGAQAGRELAADAGGGVDDEDDEPVEPRRGGTGLEHGNAFQGDRRAGSVLIV